MHYFLLIVFSLLSSVSYSQSYLILNNGITLTTDIYGALYDLGNFTLPYKVKYTGGQFFIMDEKILFVDKAGFLYERIAEVKKVKGGGANYFINQNHEIFTFDLNGFSYNYKHDRKMIKKIYSYGGRFFLVMEDKAKKVASIYVVDSKGQYKKTKVEGLDPIEISILGGSYFQTNNGILYTVSQEGLIFKKEKLDIEISSIKGTNFFFDKEGGLFTISSEGYLFNQIVSGDFDLSEIYKTGSNYFILKNGQMYSINDIGILVQVSPEHDMTRSQITSYQALH